MEIPQLIANRFRLEGELGRGGMGAVYRAIHLGLERPVAIKVLKPEFAADPEVADRFMREARTMAKLRHSRAAMIYDAGRLPDGRPFIVMEYVEGQTLADTLARDGRFAPERAVRIACEICEVLSEAHALGIVHRDLKPSNIMINSRGVSVLDFGIAKVLAGNSTDITRTHATTEAGLIIGTPRYMSPEQCLGQTVGPASDLYSVGILLYEMLAGAPPFMEQMQSAVLVRQATAPPPPLQSRRTDVPRRLALATHALLAKNPQERPKTAGDARLLLEQSLAAVAATRPPDAAAADVAVPGTNVPGELLPFASTLATLDARRLPASRFIVFAAVMVACSGALLLAWSRLGPTTSAQAGGVMTPAGFATARPNVKTAWPALSPEAARHIAASAGTQGVIADARHVRTPRGPVIIAIENRRHEGASRLVILEPRGVRTWRASAITP